MKLATIASSRRLRIGSGIFGALLIVGGLAALFHQQSRLQDQQDDMRWQLAIQEANRDADLLDPTVGVIQFLKNGYSITLDTVDYTPAGLRLAGEIGNPKSVNVSSLTVKVEAYRPAYQLRKNGSELNLFDFYMRKPLSIGQASVGFLPSGGQQRFAVTLASLTQAMRDSVELGITFTGERYSFLR